MNEEKELIELKKLRRTQIIGSDNINSNDNSNAYQLLK